MGGKRRNASVFGAFQKRGREKQPEFLHYTNVSQGQEISTNGWTMGKMMSNCLKNSVVGNNKSLRCQDLRVYVEKPRPKGWSPTQLRPSPLAAPSLRVRPTSPLPRVSRSQPLPSLPRWSPVSWSLHPVAPAGGCLPLPYILDRTSQPGASAVRMQSPQDRGLGRGVAAAGESLLDAGRSWG